MNLPRIHRTEHSVQRPTLARDPAPSRPVFTQHRDGRLIHEAFASAPQLEKRSPADLFDLTPKLKAMPDLAQGALRGPLRQAQDPEAARKRIEDWMQGYDPGSSDADQIAERIAENPDLLEELTPGERELLIRGLFDGPTSESEEDAAVKILLHGATPAEVQQVVLAIGWECFVDELDGHDLQQIANALL